jgi:hypothetical protein
MLKLFTSPRKRLEARMTTLCLNIEKPRAVWVINTLDRPAWLLQPAAKIDHADSLALNVLARTDRPAGAFVQPLLIGRKRRR